MIELFQANLVPLLIALAIGLATGWWAFRHRRNS
jgi:type IV secretory pathway TrbL component